MVRGSMGSWVTGSVILLRQEAGHLGVVQKAQGVGRLGAREQQVQHLLIGKRIPDGACSHWTTSGKRRGTTHTLSLSPSFFLSLALCEGRRVFRSAVGW